MSHQTKAALILAIAVCAVLPTGTALAQAAAGDAPEGLLALYLFEEGEGTSVRDSSRIGGPAPTDLQLSDTGVAAWEDDGIWFRSTGPATAVDHARLATEGAAPSLTEAIQATGEFTIEALLHPEDITATGPARIVSLSLDTAVRNFTLGQEDDRYVLRLRTSATDSQGTPEIVTLAGALKPELQHVVVTVAGGLVRIYVDGVVVALEQRGGDFSTWDPSYRFVLGNEVTRDRQWYGGFHLVALYDRVLTPGEIWGRYEGTAE